MKSILIYILWGAAGRIWILSILYSTILQDSKNIPFPKACLQDLSCSTQHAIDSRVSPRTRQEKRNQMSNGQGSPLNDTLTREGESFGQVRQGRRLTPIWVTLSAPFPQRQKKKNSKLICGVVGQTYFVLACCRWGQSGVGQL